MPDASYFNLLPADREMVETLHKSAYDMAREAKMPAVTREMSLFLLLDYQPSLIKRLEACDIKGREMYTALHFQFETYREWGAPPQKKSLISDDEGEQWKVGEAQADVQFLALLKNGLFQLCRKPDNVDETVEQRRENILLACFAKAADQTCESEGGSSFIDFSGLEQDNNQLDRTNLLKQYLFDDRLIGSEKLKPKLADLVEGKGKTKSKSTLFKFSTEKLWMTSFGLSIALTFGPRLLSRNDTAPLPKPNTPHNTINLVLPENALRDTVQVKALQRIIEAQPK